MINNVTQYNYSNSPSFYSKKIKKNKLINPSNENLKMVLGSNNIEIIRKIYNIAKQTNTDVFLFGGAVRDCLLGKTAQDLDFIVNGDALNFAKTLNSSDKNVFKKIFLKPSVKRATVYTCNRSIDINPLNNNGEHIQGKLNIKKALINNIKSKDFTINTMVLQILEDTANNIKFKFIDIMRSKKDLKENKLRTVKNTSIDDDPIRALRGIRFKLKYNMKTENQTHFEINRGLKNPANKKNFYYYRLIREYYRIIKTIFASLFK